MPATDYAHSLQGLTVNLLVADMHASLEFQREVIGAAVLYSDTVTPTSTMLEITHAVTADDRVTVRRMLREYQAQLDVDLAYQDYF